MNYCRTGIDVLNHAKVSFPLPSETLRRLTDFKKWRAVLEENKHWRVATQGDLI